MLKCLIAFQFTVLVFRLEALQAQCYTKLVPPTKMEVAGFGVAVSIDSTWVLVGANDGNEGSMGSAFIYRKTDSAFVLDTVLRNNEPSVFDGFGLSVTISESLAVIGAPRYKESGAAYVFRRVNSDWKIDAILQPSNAEKGMSFGSSVVIKDDLIIVGGPDFSSAKGMVSVFRHNDSGWVEIDQLVGNHAHARFGWALTCTEKYLFVGSPFENKETGAAYVYHFESSKLSFLQRISEGVGSWFGFSLDASSDRFICGAPREDLQRRERTVYLYEFRDDVWRKKSNVSSLSKDHHHEFGSAISISGNNVVVSGVGEQAMNPVFVLDFDLEKKISIQAPTTWNGYGFGSVVIVRGETLVVGAMADTQEGHGAVFIYDIECLRHR